jgi:hypothetical protein
MTLTNEDKRRAKINLLNDKAKELLSQLDTLTTEDLAFQDWELDLSKWKLYAPDKLKLQFKLKKTAMEKRLQELDANQRTIDDALSDIEEGSIEDELNNLEEQTPEEDEVELT